MYIKPEFTSSTESEGSRKINSVAIGPAIIVIAIVTLAVPKCPPTFETV